MVVTTSQWRIGLGILAALKSIMFGVLMFAQPLAPNRVFWVQAINYLVLSPLLLTGSIFNVAQLVEIVFNPDLVQENNADCGVFDEDGDGADQINSDGDEDGMSKETKARLEFLGAGFVNVEKEELDGKTKLLVAEIEGGIPMQQEFLI